MARSTFLLFVIIAAAYATGLAQIDLSGQTAAHFLKSTPSRSPRTVNYGRPSFGFESYLFIDGRISDHVAAFTTVSVEEDQIINLDYAAIRITDITPLGFNFQAGRFDLPFGNLGERRFPRKNFLYGLPLIYEYGTSLPDRPTTDQEVLAARGTGSGMPLLDGGVYDLGAMLFGSLGILDYAIAASSGTISATTYGTKNSNSDIGTVARLSISPIPSFTLGAAYAQGAYMDEAAGQGPTTINVNNYRQQAVELDLEFSLGHAVLYGEAVYNRWPVPLAAGDQDFKVFGYYIEGKYTLIPRLYVALRLSGLTFGQATLNQQQQPWDYDVAELESGLGYFIDRDVLLKIVRRDTRTYGGTNPKDGLTVIQIAVAY
jgi:hypothetical protein